jgi:hypothetical protein
MECGELIRRGESVVASARTDSRRILQNSTNAPRRGQPKAVEKIFVRKSWTAAALIVMEVWGHQPPSIFWFTRLHAQFLTVLHGGKIPSIASRISLISLPHVLTTKRNPF